MTCFSGGNLKVINYAVTKVSSSANFLNQTTDLCRDREINDFYRHPVVDFIINKGLIAVVNGGSISEGLLEVDGGDPARN